VSKRDCCSYRAANNARVGFTLIEILAVIAIIGLIAAATLVALGGARGFFSSVTTKSRLDDVAQCLEMYKQKFGEYPPDCCATKAEIRRHILKRWPRTLKSGVVDDMVELAFNETADEGSDPGVAALFWMAGVPDKAGDEVAYDGFLADEENPFGVGMSGDAIGKEPRETPIIELTFDSDGSQGGNYNKLGLIFKGQPIVYFRNDYEGKDKHVPGSGVAAPYMKGGKWYNADSFQLVLPGEDGSFGDHNEEGEEQHEHGRSGEDRDLKDADSVSIADWDNITNFSNGATLESERDN